MKPSSHLHPSSLIPIYACFEFQSAVKPSHTSKAFHIGRGLVRLRIIVFEAIEK